jgi:hypothetical protein
MKTEIWTIFLNHFVSTLFDIPNTRSCSYRNINKTISSLFQINVCNIKICSHLLHMLRDTFLSV